MVKGVSRQVVLVRPKNSELFEQAIFLVRGEAQACGEITDEMLLQQAEDAAKGAYGAQVRGKNGLRLLLGAALGGGLVGLLWLIFSIL